MQLPDKYAIASFDVDAQKTFTPLCPSELPVPEGDQIVAALNTQSQYARLRVGSKDAHSPQSAWIASDTQPALSVLNGEEYDIAWPQHAVPGTLGFELLDGLPKITDYDYFIWKGVELDIHPYGACYHDLKERISTGVIEYLKAEEISTVIVGGLATDYCVKHTALQLQRADFQVVIHLSACRGVAEESTQAAMNEMKAAGIYLVPEFD